MSIRVEFYGIARKRAGVEVLEVEGDNLGDVFDRLADQLPKFSAECLRHGKLKPAYLANVNGRDFTSKRETLLSDGDAVLIVSADAGG